MHSGQKLQGLVDQLTYFADLKEQVTRPKQTCPTLGLAVIISPPSHKRKPAMPNLAVVVVLFANYFLFHAFAPQARDWKNSLEGAKHLVATCMQREWNV
ncbi:hypothetical protein GMOD_00008031 [Pyrenophora seminiperda CCB06]|uniref:Uncharacterized protein n=1 Tax=Pyrenophora seminiperda CCB06 TaxID=1302712 RepID=A0A3M7MGF3_9PLEO|nr:hypothetical protein GMOD_00008031 [Pyrenophora seminiperda CCB06]